MSLPFLHAAQQALILSGVLAIIGSPLLFGIRKRKGEAEQAPPPPVPRREPPSREALMRMVGLLESLLAKTGSSVADGTGRKWFLLTRAEVEAMKRCIDADDRAGAARRLGSAEMYIKMLELSIAGG